MAGENTSYTTNSKVQTDPKIEEFNNEISSLKEKLNLYNSYIAAYTVDGKFNMAPVIEDIKTASDEVLKKAKEIRQKEEGGDGSSCTYVKVVRDPELVITAISPREFKASDIIYYQYTEGYNTEDKQKKKNSDGKTPTKIYKTVKRTLENDSIYKNFENTLSKHSKVYKAWLKGIDKYDEVKKKIASVEEKKAKYIKKKEEEEYNAKVKKENKEKREQEKQQAAAQKEEEKLNNAKPVIAVKDKLKTYTDGADGPSTFVKYKDADQYLEKNFYPITFTIKYHEEYVALGIDKNGLVYKEEAEDFELLKERGQEIIDLADKILTQFKEAYAKDKNAPKPDYSEIERKSKTFKNSALALVRECAEMKELVENAIGAIQRREEEAQKARQNENVSEDAEKKSVADNISAETMTKMEEADTNGKGTLDGKSGSPETASGEGELSDAETNNLVADAVFGQEQNKEEQAAPTQEEKYQDEDNWTDEKINEIKSKKPSSSDDDGNQGEDTKIVLANIASNIVGSMLMDPSFAQTTNGMSSTGKYDNQSIAGMGNGMLESSKNAAINAAMNAAGVGAAEQMADDVFKATNTILVTATNIVPMIKELTVATVMTVQDELTSHVVEKVESILDPIAITSKMQEYTSYYMKLYIKGADDFKKELLNPGDAAMENEIEEKSEQAKSAKMKNMTVKIANIKSKVQDGVAMAKSGVRMVTTYINNGPDWVIKQLNSYTNFAIAQAEKYIDYGAEYVTDQRDMWIAQTAESIGKRMAEKTNKKLEQVTKKQLDYIEVKKKYATQVAMASLMTAVQIVVSKLGPMLGMAVKAGVKVGMKQLLKTIGG